MKKRWLAALLNLIPLPFPLGYAYLDRWGRFFAFSFIRCCAGVISLLFWVVIWIYCTYCGDWRFWRVLHCSTDGNLSCSGIGYDIFKWAGVLGPLLLILALNARGAWKAAEEDNAELVPLTRRLEVNWRRNAARKGRSDRNG